MAEQVIIEFIADTGQLQPAEDRLEALGKIDAKSASVFKSTNTELAKREAILKGISEGTNAVVVSATKEQTIYNKLLVSLKTLSGASKTAVQDLLKLPLDQIAAGFDNAAITVDDYVKTLQAATGSTETFTDTSVSLRQQLKQLTAQIAQMKLAGTDSGETFDALVIKAGQIKDAINDAGQEIKNFSSDTRGVDNLIGSVTALAGGFAAVQGASAIFGDDQKDLQETLVKVSGAMAVLQGIQSLQNALQKEGAITLTFLNAQTKLAAIQTQLLAIAEGESAIAAAAATVAQKALNLAMSANPIGLVITALVALAGILVFFASKATSAATAQAELNQVIKNGTEGFKAFSDGATRALDKQVSDLERNGARTSEIQKRQISVEIQLQNDRVDRINELNEVIVKNQDSTNKETIELVGKAQDELNKLTQDNQDSLVKIYQQTNTIRKQLLTEQLTDETTAAKDRLSLAAEGSREQLNAQLKLIQAQAALDVNAAGDNAVLQKQIRDQANKDRLDAEIAFNRRALELQKQQLTTQQENLTTIDGTLEQQHILRLKLIQNETATELANARLSEKEKSAIRAAGFQKRLQEDKEFNDESLKRTLQAEIDKNKAVLDQRNTDSATALDLTIENITLAAQIEIDATKNNAAKVKEIIAQRDKDIRDAKLSTIQRDLDDELKLQAAITGVQVRANNERQLRLKDAVDKNKISTVDYYNALTKLIDANTKVDLDANKTKLDALNKELADGLISYKNYNIDYEVLIDEQAKIVEDGEARKRQAAIDTAELQKKKNQEVADFTVQTISQVGSILFDNLQNQLDQQQSAIDDRKKKIDDLKSAGKISEKEAIDRLNQIDREERKLKRQQAQKDKEQAIFNAVINTAQAVIKAFATTGPIAGAVLAAIVGAIGAAQIAVIASKPIPQFFKGKRNSYTGLGTVAEHGAELIERGDGSLEVATKKQMVWLGKKDIVYTARETASMTGPAMTKSKPGSIRSTDKPFNIDYDKMGAAVGKHLQTNVYVDGVQAQSMEANKLTNYLNSRRGY